MEMGASKLMMSNKKLFLKKILMELDEDINDSEYNILNDLIDNIDIIQKYSIREAAKIILFQLLVFLDFAINLD